MLDLFAVKQGQTVEVQFTDDRFGCQVVHYVRTPETARWRTESCMSRDCTWCLQGGRAIQRYTANIKHDGKHVLLHMPRELFLYVYAALQQMRTHAFLSGTFAIERLPGIPSDYTFSRVE